MFVRLVNYDGKIQQYPVAAYAAVYANDWMSAPEVERWMSSQSQPIPYAAIVDFFEQLKERTPEPKIFNAPFRAATQILAAIGRTISPEILSSILPTAFEIKETVYGCTVRVNANERDSAVNKLKENGFIISASNRHRNYDGQFLIWVVGASSFYPPTDAHYKDRNTMQPYWVERNRQAIQRPALMMKTPITQNRQDPIKVDQRVTGTNYIEGLHDRLRFQRKVHPEPSTSPASTFFKDPKEKINWKDLQQIADHTGIPLQELNQTAREIIKKEQIIPGMYQDPSIALQVQIELNDKISRAEFYAYIAWGAKPNHQDFFKESLLHIALTRYKTNKKHYLECISWLLDVGADINLKDEKGQTPRQLAESLRIMEAIELFNTHESRIELERSSKNHA